MIGFLQWKIIDISMTQAIILTQSWVWYTVLINEIIYSKLVLEEESELFIYHHRTENSENLFGFLEKADKQIFTELIKISWIWWKVAMQILSLGVENLISAVQSWDNKMIESIKWIWKKMAEKIILELKDKEFAIEIAQNISLQDNQTNNLDSDIASDLKNTLTNMWYAAKDVEEVLKKVPEDLSEIWEILPFCIRELS